MSVDTELAAATKPKKQRSKCVACLCSPITLVITVLVLIGLALTLYFSWPRNPDIYVSIPTDRPFVQGVDLQTKSSNTVEGLLQASEANPFTLVLNLTALVTAFSHNYIDVYANKISVLINILDDSGKELPGLSGESVLTGINFAKKANTSVNAGVQVFYRLSKPVTSIGQDPVLPFIYTKCFKTPSKITARVFVRLDLELIAWARIYPEVTETVTADCSVQEKDILNGFQSLIGDRFNLTEFSNSQVGGIIRNVTTTLGGGLKDLVT